MAQIRRDRLAQVWVAPTAEDQIRGLWRERAPIERNFAGILALEAWLTHNAPELLQGHGESHPYLLRLLDGEIEN